MKSSKKYFQNSVALIIVLVLLLGCSKVEKKDEKLEKINFQLSWFPFPDQVFYWVAKEKGYYQNEGLDIEFIFGKGSTFSSQAVGSGRVKIGSAAANTALVARANGMPIISVAVIHPDSQVCIFSLKKKNITSPEDLINKVISINRFTANYVDFKAFLDINNLTKANITEIHTTENILSLLKENADADVKYLANEAYILREKQELNNICVKDYGVDVHGSVIIVNEDFLEKNPETISKFIKATMKGLNYTYNYPNDSFEIFYRHNPDINYELFKEMFTTIYPEFVDTNTFLYGFGYQSKEKWEKNKEILISQNVINNTKLRIENFYTNEFLYQ